MLFKNQLHWGIVNFLNSNLIRNVDPLNTGAADAIFRAREDIVRARQCKCYLFIFGDNFYSYYFFNEIKYKKEEIQIIFIFTLVSNVVFCWAPVSYQAYRSIGLTRILFCLSCLGISGLRYQRQLKNEKL